MTKIQLGNSSCQIEGVYVPVADMNLAAGDGIYFTHHVLLWKDPQVTISAMPLAGAWKRVFAGLPLIMTQAAGPGHIAFSRDDPGELMPVPLQPGEALDVREHLFLVATASVAYDWFPTNVWLKTQQGNETETHYPVGMFMDRFTAPQAPGLLLLHAAGNVFVRRLAEGETILVKPTALVFKDPSVQMHLHFERPGTVFHGWGNWTNRYLWLRLTGPGRVAIQSVFERIEGEARNLSSCSYATEQRW
ncbi:MAG TPA: AIM24 family protein [Bryobacteraceae bacterium]|nr:AIM24 family protein [Bryobacteraceae bacterium]